MAFQYYGDTYFKGLDYSPITGQDQQQQQSPMSQIDPNQLTTMIQKIMGTGGAGQAAPAGQGGASQLVGAGIAGGGNLAGLAGSAGSGGAAQLSGASLAGGGGSGGSGAMSAMGGVMSNPWAWLAAAVVGNELYAKHRGYRREGMDYWKDLFSGEVLHQDIEKRFLPDIGIDEDSKWNKRISVLVNPYTLNPKRTLKRWKEAF